MQADGERTRPTVGPVAIDGLSPHVGNPRAMWTLRPATHARGVYQGTNLNAVSGSGSPLTEGDITVCVCCRFRGCAPDDGQRRCLCGLLVPIRCSLDECGVLKLLHLFLRTGQMGEISGTLACPGGVAPPKWYLGLVPRAIRCTAP